MSDYIEYDNKVAFHPGYYIKEIIAESGLTQEDFAKRLDTTPKNLSILIRGEQSLSKDIAMKLSRLLGTSIGYWLNLQKTYDTLVAEFASDQELEEERKIFDLFEYNKCFRDKYGLEDCPRDKNAQIKNLREFLNVSTLRAFTKVDMAASFRSASNNLSEANIVKANAMVQIATNRALKVDAPKYDKKKFEVAVDYALTLTNDHDTFYEKINGAFRDAGVILEILPNISGSNTNGATKKIGNNIVLMVNDRRLYSDTFWFTLFHEIGHIMNGDYGISFDEEKGEMENKADRYAQDKLIDPDRYHEFILAKRFDAASIKAFARSINRDPGIVLGRLQNDRLVGYTDRLLNSLKHKYKVSYD
ncbi:HigA family addiction module antitoxin [Oribacterium sp. WCC10]|uniref:HigA family addiction module antitoxin n=1 Tax=Oribacterium sp. WCC10 TaxID=1855343 RepID=UPI0008E89AB5|nr:HigA family addiction module antitoxin [Oribacterium sp. WCC10]SFG27337.1 addiction module antidote protein, HigA family [Oribacterium sp. WCC10]